MHFSKQGLKPCSNCLRARQRIKDVARAMSGRYRAAYLLIECQNADVTLLTATREITATSPGFEHLIGVEVYLGGRWVMNVKTAQRITALGTIVKQSAVD